MQVKIWNLKPFFTAFWSNLQPFVIFNLFERITGIKIRFLTIIDYLSHFVPGLHHKQLELSFFYILILYSNKIGLDREFRSHTSFWLQAWSHSLVTLCFAFWIVLILTDAHKGIWMILHNLIRTTFVLGTFYGTLI